MYALATQTVNEYDYTWLELDYMQYELIYLFFDELEINPLSYRNYDDEIVPETGLNLG